MGQALKEAAEEKSELEMTPMIDVTFLLLIFFMCTLKFKTLEGKLAAYLPKDVGVNQDDAEPIEKVEILVRLKRDSAGNKMTGLKLKPGTPPEPFTDAHEGRYQWNTQRLVDQFPELGKHQIRAYQYTVGPFRTSDLLKLEENLRKTHDKRKDTMPMDEKTGERKKVPATIDARTQTVYEDIALVLDAAINAGFEEITFVGDHGDDID